MVNRYLRFKGLRVTFVKNFTDVDDKIIKRANDEGLPATGVSERYIAEYRADMASIGVLPPDIEPKATEHIPEMVALIERLIMNGVAYAVDGDVYFEVRRFPAYGALSGKNIEDLEAGARVDVDERKRDPLDFALWKAAKPGEPAWPSPWGPGRPGWHIECSAMAMRYLGESFDLHGGGEDLIFPHHENEIAQSEAATARPFVRVLAAQRIRQSGIGEDVEVARQYAHDPGHGAASRPRGHSPLSPRDALPASPRVQRRAHRRGRAGARAALRAQGGGGADCRQGKPTPPGADGGLLDEVAAQRARFEAAMDDDFNTPQALGVLFDLARVLNTARDQVTHGTAGAGAFLLGVAELSTLAGVLGLLEGAAREREPVDAQLKARVESLVNRRQEARKQRDFAEADRLRDELTGLGVLMEDTPGGTTWKLR